MKAVIQAQETASILDPSIDIGKAAMEEARDALVSGLTLDNIEKTATATGLRVGKELVRPTLESAAFMWIDQFGRGKITVAIGTSDLDTQFRQLDDTGRRLTVGLLTVGQLIGTAILAVVLLQPAVAETVGPLANLAVAAFFGVLVYSLVVVYRVGRRPDDDRAAEPRAIPHPGSTEHPRDSRSGTTERVPF